MQQYKETRFHNTDKPNVQWRLPICNPSAYEDNLRQTVAGVRQLKASNTFQDVFTMTFTLDKYQPSPCLMWSFPAHVPTTTFLAKHFSTTYADAAHSGIPLILSHGSCIQTASTWVWRGLRPMAGRGHLTYCQNPVPILTSCWSSVLYTVTNSDSLALAFDCSWSAARVSAIRNWILCLKVRGVSCIARRNAFPSLFYASAPVVQGFSGAHLTSAWRSMLLPAPSYDHGKAASLHLHCCPAVDADDHVETWFRCCSCEWV